MKIVFSRDEHLVQKKDQFYWKIHIKSQKNYKFGIGVIFNFLDINSLSSCVKKTLLYVT